MQIQETITYTDMDYTLTRTLILTPIIFVLSPLMLCIVKYIFKSRHNQQLELSYKKPKYIIITIILISFTHLLLFYIIGCSTLIGLEGHICPSLVRDWKDIYVSLLWSNDGVIVTPFKASWTCWCKTNNYIVVSGHELLKYGE